MLGAPESPESHRCTLGGQSLSSSDCPDSGPVPLLCALGLVHLGLCWQGHEVWPCGSAGRGCIDVMAGRV